MYDTTGARMTAQVWTGTDATGRALAADGATAVPTNLPPAPQVRVRQHGVRAFLRKIRGLDTTTTSRFAPA